MWVFENRLPRKAFWPEREEVRGEGRNLHDEELYHINKGEMSETLSMWDG